MIKKITMILMMVMMFLSPFSIFLNKNNENQSARKFSYNLEITNNVTYATGLVVIKDGYLDCEGVDLACYGINFLQILFADIGTVFTGLSAKFMDFFLQHSIQSSSYRSSNFIEQGWEILRDVTNIIFIFALIYIAFELVLGIGKDAKGRLIKVILVTLVINFSLFVSYAIIDTSNVFAHVFYNKIVQDKVEFKNISNSDLSDEKIEADNSVSLALAAKIQPQKIFLESDGMMTKGKRFLMVIMVGVINGALIYVFLSVAFLFLGRTIGLMISSILAPLAFASITIPGLKDQEYIGFGKWFSSLLKMSFMAPIFLFILYLAVEFMNVNMVASSSSGKFLDNFLSIVIPMAAVVVLLLVGKKVADKMSGDFAGVISSFVAKGAMMVGGVALGAATGGAALAGRATAGKWAHKAMNDPNSWAGNKLRSLKTNDSKWAVVRSFKRGIGNAGLAGARKAEKASFNANKTGFGKFVSKQGNKAGISMSQPSWMAGKAGGAGGYKAYDKREDKKVKADKEFMDMERKELTKQKTQKNQDLKKNENELVKDIPEAQIVQSKIDTVRSELDLHEKKYNEEYKKIEENYDISSKEKNKQKEIIKEKYENNINGGKKFESELIKERTKKVKEKVGDKRNDLIKKVSELNNEVNTLGTAIREKDFVSKEIGTGTRNQEQNENIKNIAKSVAMTALIPVLGPFAGLTMSIGGLAINEGRKYFKKKGGIKIFGKTIGGGQTKTERRAEKMKDKNIGKPKPLTDEERRKELEYYEKRKEKGEI